MHTIKIKNQNILLISDTHGKHRLLDIPAKIDIIIHCGDICNDGNMDEIIDFFNWFSALLIPHKIFVHGNHDLPFDLEPEQSALLIPKGIIWLNDAAIQVNKVNIIGISPFPFYNDIEISERIDIIISHYPPQGILDDGFGFKAIKDFVMQAQADYHVFGHNHANYGKTQLQNVIFINASVFNLLNS